MIFPIKEPTSWKPSFQSKPEETVIEMSNFRKFDEFEGSRGKLEIDMIV